VLPAVWAELQMVERLPVADRTGLQAKRQEKIVSL
jgi:hypothetical protein